jgi:colicin import membrane protein
LILHALIRIGLTSCLLLGVAAASAADAVRSAADIERLFRSGETALALQQIDLAIAAKPRDASLWFQKGLMLLESQRTAEAIAVYERLTQEYPELAEAYNNLAVLQAGDGRLDAARELLETALRNDPGYRTARENLGDIHLRLALRSFEQAASGTTGSERLERKLRRTRELVEAR